ncbi:GNAT family N-acetyltransferase [Oceanivirga miroungae]|uniref:N-acetyltransferase GCN5 n=1 Tax=Oceanivirga miroungae TaxID=1130046 RepID=A0A6I8MCR5_9FUSO|nr:N-acetyltransferase [Oceanivirga miroungae]VWL84919.1 N-acetyltransferase GCN5 [Oceanivirga miroungae]
MTNIIKKLDAKKDRDLLEKIYKYEEDIFKSAAVGQYNIVPFAKYGNCYVIYNEADIISVVEVIYSLNNIAYFYGVSTNLKYRHLGFATKLINFVLEDFKNKNIKSIELTVSKDNENAIKLYKKFGFKIFETLDNEYFDNENRYLMVKNI